MTEQNIFEGTGIEIAVRVKAKTPKAKAAKDSVFQVKMTEVEAELIAEREAEMLARLETAAESMAKSRWSGWLGGGQKNCFVSVRSGELNTVLTKKEMKAAGWIK